MGKNVAVFVDVANIFYAAKAAGVDIDYVTLLKASSAGRDLVRAYAYTGLDPDNENQRNFHDFLRRNGYRVVSKDIRKYGDGKVKANLDIELVVDMMKTARNLDVAIVVSGDGDFAPAIRAVQEQGVRVEVVSFRGNTSSDLMDVADLFTDITQIARVEKGSSRSGRRVASDDDLSMTEVPDKQSEGTGDRGRGRGRTRRTAAVSSPTRTRGRTAAPAADGDAPIVVLPGEKLSRVAASAAPSGDGDAPDEAELDEAATADGGDEAGFVGEDGRRRRRRRGGRGRGRGRGRDEAGYAEGESDAPERVSVAGVEPSDEDEDEIDEAPAPARRPASSFGSVWDSQIGIPASRAGTGTSPVLDEDEDLEEPAVPEYLLAERRRRDGGGRGPARGGRGRGGAYAAALDRERFGGGRGSTPSRFGEPPPRREGSFGRPDQGRGRRDERPDRGERRDRPPFREAPRPAPRGSGDEPWSEVPPEIEAMLRAQLGSRPASGASPAPSEPPAGVLEPGEDAMGDAAAAAGDAPGAPASRRGSARTGTRSSSGAGASRARRSTSIPESEGDGGSVDAGADAEAPAPTPPRRATARRARSASSDVTDAAKAVPASGAEAEAPAARKPASRRTTTSRAGSRATSSKSASTADASGDVAQSAEVAEEETAAPKRRTTRRKAEPTA